MPTYEYACKECDEHLEVHQSFADPALTDCPACGGRLRKVFGNIAITFKGSGFYKTDSRDSAKKGATKAKDGESSTAKSEKGEKSEKSASSSESSSTPASSAAPAAAAS